MLQRIRDRSSGPLAYAIVGLIALVFSVWGLGSYFTGTANPAVAEVGDAQITKYQLKKAYNQRYRRLQQMMGERFNTDEFNQEQFRKRILQSLIQKTLLRQYAQDAGYRVTDEAVLQALRQDPRFQADGHFSVERYKTLLSRAGITTEAFENRIRNQKQVAQIRMGVLRTAVVSQKGVQHTLARLKQERQIAYLAYEPKAFRDEVKVSKDEVKAYYSAHSKQFMRELRVKLTYILLERDQLDITAEPSKKDLKSLYEQVKKQRFQTPERRMARHVLVRVDDNTSAKQARQTIQKLASRLKHKDTDFADLARKVSDDQSTATDGGNIGWVSRSTMERGFKETLFSMEEGDISNPVKTDAGWHLVKLVKVDPGEFDTFGDPQVQSELKALYDQRQRKQRYQKKADRLETLSYQTGTSLQPIAEKLDLKMRTTEWITRSGGDGIASNKAVITAAFSSSVFEDDLNSTPIQIAPGRQVVLRIKARKPAQTRPLSEVRDRIRQRLIQKQATQLAYEQAQQALQSLREGAAFSDVAQSGSGDAVKVGWIDRQSKEVPAAVNQTAFAMPVPGSDKQATYASTAKQSQTIAVVRLADTRTPDLNESKAVKRIKQSLRRRIAGSEFRALRQSLRAQYDVTIYEERI